MLTNLQMHEAVGSSAHRGNWLLEEYVLAFGSCFLDPV